MIRRDIVVVQAVKRAARRRTKMPRLCQSGDGRAGPSFFALQLFGLLRCNLTLQEEYSDYK